MNYNCASCGAPIEIKNRFSKVAVCSYCGTHHRVSVDGLDPSGKQPKLAAFPSLVSVGAKGMILGKDFSVSGRVRYRYDGGFFDEWFLEYDGEAAWLTEDEGMFTLYTDLLESADVTESFDSIRPGQNIMVGDKRVMVKEKGRATVEGGEGELFYEASPGDEISYLDAVAEGKRLSIE
ncbi:MAG TPA: DUF4178 domain-containing protein, partial [Spirochaetota bacterium]